MNIAVIGSRGRMGSFHHTRLNEEYPDIGIYLCDNGVEGYVNDMVTEDYESVVDVVDAAIIATPSDTHYEIASELIQQGKHVLVEKPLCENYEQAQALYRLSQEYDVVLMAGHTERFNPVFRKRLPELYKWKTFEFYRHAVKPQDGRDPIWDLMIHDLEIFCYLTNSADPDDWRVEIGGDEKIPVLKPAVKSSDVFGVFGGVLSSAKAFFSVRYDSEEEMRAMMSPLGGYQTQDARPKDVVNFLDVDDDPHDPLYYEHQHFLKLCERGGYNGHARFAVAAVGLAEKIKEALDA